MSENPTLHAVTRSEPQRKFRIVTARSLLRHLEYAERRLKKLQAMRERGIRDEGMDSYLRMAREALGRIVANEQDIFGGP